MLDDDWEQLIDEGYQARLDGAEAVHNPYPPDTYEHQQWAIGWENADCDIGE